MMDPVQDVSIRYLEADYKLDLANGYLLNKWTGEFILITRIDEFLSKCGTLKRIEIVCPTNYRPVVLNRFTQKIIDHINECLADIEVLILVNATDDVLKLIGITENQTKIKQLEIIGSGRITKQVGKNLPDLVQLICSASQMPLFKSNNNIRTCYIDATHEYNDIKLDLANTSNACNYIDIVDIFDFVTRNEKLDRFSMTFYSDDLFLEPVDVEGIQSRFMELHSFEYFIIYDTHTDNIYGYKKQNEELQTSVIAMVSEQEAANITIKHMNDFKVLELSTKIYEQANIPDSLSVIGNWDAMVSLLDQHESTTATGNALDTGVNKFTQIPHITLQSGRDKIVVNQQEKSVELNIFRYFDDKLIPRNTRLMTVNYFGGDQNLGLINDVLGIIFVVLPDLEYLRLNTGPFFFKLFAEHINVNYMTVEAMENGQIAQDPAIKAYLPNLVTLMVENNSRKLAHWTMKMLKLHKLEQLSLWNGAANKPLDAAIERFGGHISANAQRLEYLQFPRDVKSLEIFFDWDLQDERILVPMPIENIHLPEEKNSSLLSEEIQAEEASRRASEEANVSQSGKAINSAADQPTDGYAPFRQKILNLAHLKDVRALYITNKWNKISTTLCESMKQHSRSKYNLVLNTIAKTRLVDAAFLKKLRVIETDLFDNEIYEMYDVILRTSTNLSKFIIRFGTAQNIAANQLLGYLQTLNLQKWNIAMHKSQIICEKVIIGFILSSLYLF